MGTKFHRERYREIAHAKLREMGRSAPRQSPRGRALHTFLIVYIGIGAYMVIGMFLESTMSAAPRTDRVTTAPAIVVERGEEPVQADPLVYELTVQVAPEEEPAFEHALHIDEASWLRAAVGDEIMIRYEKVGEEDRVLVLNVHLPPPELTESESAIALHPEGEPGPWVESIPIEGPDATP